MVKRILLVAIVVAAVLVVAAPAMAFNGLREDYTTSNFCSICHSESSAGSAPAVYERWSETQHAVAGSHGQANRLPYGSSCGGCHVANYAPAKVVPTPTRTAVSSPSPTATNVSWGAANGEATTTQMAGEAASSESFVGCSSCHYGASTGDVPEYGNDPNDTAHNSKYTSLANASICGQCHSRYSYSEATVTVASVPYVKLDAAGSPIANPSPTTLLQPQYAMGFKMLGEPPTWDPAALSTNLIVQRPGWTPSPDPSATTAAGLMTYWQVDGMDSPWSYRGHDGSASQYPEWAAEGHAAALDSVKALSGFMDITPCLECHSTDYAIADPGTVTPATAKYGVTCVGCHTPHDRGTSLGAWDEEWTPQLRTDSAKTLCVTCHNGDVPVDTQASPGAEIHHPMKEMMDGYGAIDVASFPSVHKGKCVQCHMPPTSTSPTGANHTFAIIMPEVAQEATAVGSTAVMPYSACSTCHNRPTDPYAVYLQDTIDQRQEWTMAKSAKIHATLGRAAVNLGYADEDAAHTALVAMPAAERTTAQTAFLKAFTNVGFVESEGSFGIHNWDYSRAIVNTAIVQADTAETGVVVRMPWAVTQKLSKTSVRAGTKVKFSGSVKTSKGVAATGSVTLMKRVKGVWKVWKTASLNSSGNYSKTIKMTTKGKFYMKAWMPADDDNLSAYSRPSIKLVVK